MLTWTRLFWAAETLQVKDLENSKLEPYDGTRAYAKDKRRQVALAERFAENWSQHNVAVYSMHPGRHPCCFCLLYFSVDEQPQMPYTL